MQNENEFEAKLRKLLAKSREHELEQFKKPSLVLLIPPVIMLTIGGIVLYFLGFFNIP